MTNEEILSEVRRCIDMEAESIRRLSDDMDEGQVLAVAEAIQKSASPLNQSILRCIAAGQFVEEPVRQRIYRDHSCSIRGQKEKQSTIGDRPTTVRCSP